MAIRNLLHRNQLDKFRNYMESLGRSSVEPKGYFEALRLTKPGSQPLIFYTKFGCDHITFADNHRRFVQKFINSVKAGGTN